MGLSVKLLAVAVHSMLFGVVGAVLVMNPRIHAQQRSQLQQLQRQLEQMHATEANNQQGGPWATSYWDLGQNITMTEMEGRIEANDASIGKVSDAVTVLSREQSALDARSSVWFEIIGTLVLGAISLSLTNFLKLRDRPE